jgi:UDP-N-acetylmuramoylalanine--D-glutamate ligase
MSGGAFPPDLFAGARFAVVGLGRMGLPAAQALAAMGADVAAWDDGAEARAAAVAAGLHVADPVPDIARLDALVLSPGIPHGLPRPHPAAAAALTAGVPIWTDAELLYQAVRRAGSRARFAGVTGTNGKSTTTALLAHVLDTAGVGNAAGGNLGPAALGLPLLANDCSYVLEMSSYMLERLATLRFDAAAMLNLSPDHLDRHGDMAGYAAAKRAIFARQGPGDLAVVGADDQASDALAATLPGPVVRVSGLHRADVWCEAGVLRDAGGPILAMGDAPALPGPHNGQNAACATAMALHLGASRAAIARGIATFPGLPHRQRVVAVRDGIAFVDDSKATNADAAARALACYDRLVWIAGGIAKAGGIESLAPFFPRVAHAVLIGRDAPLLATQLREAGVPHHVAGTLDAAVPDADALARRLGAGTVLLSPACASFDQFTGFEARGRRFAGLAASLAEGRAA